MFKISYLLIVIISLRFISPQGVVDGIKSTAALTMTSYPSIDNQPPLFIDAVFCYLAEYPGDQRPYRTELTFHFPESIISDAESGKQVSDALCLFWAFSLTGLR
ncbi:MAG: hypothetical protein KKD24_07360 [Proteobacteria bacterium]|nr:hypothetical protein [Pseudomonadota bacterium]